MSSFYSFFTLGLLLAFGQAATLIATPQQHILDAGHGPSSSIAKPLEKVRKELHKAEIIPTVIDEFTPRLILKAKWSSDGNHASLGNTLKPEKLQDVPSITLYGPSGEGSRALCGNSKTAETSVTTSSTTYVITLTDPDAPSRDDPKWSEMCHWIGISSPKDGPTRSDHGVACSRSLNLDLDNEIIPYKPPGPPEKTGRHRYVIFALVPANGTTEKIYPSKPKDRQHWGYDGPDEETGKTHGVRDWARENGLVVVGANFIYAQNKKQ